MSGCRIGKVTPKLKAVEPFPYPVNGDAVEYLSHALEQAKSGEFRSIGVVAVSARGYVQTAFSLEQGENPLLVTGGIEWLSKRIMEAI